MQSSKDRFYIYPKEKLSMSGEQGNFSRRDFIKTAGAAFSALPTEIKANINNLDAMRIKNAVNAELKAKGLVLTSKNPDFLIAADIVTIDKKGHAENITKLSTPIRIMFTQVILLSIYLAFF
jgi:hypothetical protein